MHDEKGFFVLVSRTGLVIRPGTRGEVFEWLADDDMHIDDFDAAIAALNADGWHHAFYPTEEEAIEAARDGIYCHGQWYYPAA